MKFYVDPDPYVVEQDDNGFFPSLKEANQDPLLKVYKEREEKLVQLEEHYRDQPPFADDDIRLIKQQQDKYELKKLLNNNLEKITLPADRPHYGPGAIVPNSVLVRNRIIDMHYEFLFFTRSGEVTLANSSTEKTRTRRMDATDLIRRPITSIRKK
jgi:hypothetical protein